MDFTDKKRSDEVSIFDLHEIAGNGNRPYVLDVRTHFEWVATRLPFTSERVSYDAVADALDRLPEDRSHPIYVYCRVGNRSRFVTDYLKAIGYRRVFNVTGGIVAWTLAGLPVERGE